MYSLIKYRQVLLVFYYVSDTKFIFYFRSSEFSGYMNLSLRVQPVVRILTRGTPARRALRGLSRCPRTAAGPAPWGPPRWRMRGGGRGHAARAGRGWGSGLPRWLRVNAFATAVTNRAEAAGVLQTTRGDSKMLARTRATTLASTGRPWALSRLGAATARRPAATNQLAACHHCHQHHQHRRILQVAVLAQWPQQQHSAGAGAIAVAAAAAAATAAAVVCAAGGSAGNRAQVAECAGSGLGVEESRLIELFTTSKVYPRLL